MNSLTYQYQAFVDRWVDGDTVDLHIDLGFRMFTLNRFRLYGIDTPERGQKGWAEASSFAKSNAPDGTLVVAKTYKDPDKYGRWLADIVLPDGTSINQMLLDANLAKPYYGGTKS